MKEEKTEGKRREVERNMEAKLGRDKREREREI
jgi:hypothetical protein